MPSIKPILVSTSFRGQRFSCPDNPVMRLVDGSTLHSIPKDEWDSKKREYNLSLLNGEEKLKLKEWIETAIPIGMGFFVSPIERELWPK